VFPLTLTFDRENSSAKVGELGEFLLDFLQPFKPLAMSNLSRRMRCISSVTLIVVIRLLKLGDLLAETPDLLAKHRWMIHGEWPTLNLIHEPDVHIRQSLSSIHRLCDLGLGRVLF